MNLARPRQVVLAALAFGLWLILGANPVGLSAGQFLYNCPASSTSSAQESDTDSQISDSPFVTRRLSQRLHEFTIKNTGTSVLRCATTTRIETLVPAGLEPVYLAVSWQFQYRAALPPRAPSSVS